MIGKELLELNYETDSPGRTILSTYVHSSADDVLSEDESSKTSDTEKEGLDKMKAARPELGSILGDNATLEDPASDSHGVALANHTSEYSIDSTVGGSAIASQNASEPRRRFTDSLSTLQIEEAKATGRAQLQLAFEMLTMMKKRALRADPEAYQCLIDACGRVGDTQRATDLLGKMHEDGIVADGTVYACLVSAFSAETAWKKGTKEEDLPGKICRRHHFVLVTHF